MVITQNPNITTTTPFLIPFIPVLSSSSSLSLDSSQLRAPLWFQLHPLLPSKLVGPPVFSGDVRVSKEKLSSFPSFFSNLFSLFLPFLHPSTLASCSGHLEHFPAPVELSHSALNLGKPPLPFLLCFLVHARIQWEWERSEFGVLGFWA